MEMSTKIFKDMTAIDKAIFEIEYAFCAERKEIDYEILAYQRALEMMLSPKPVRTEQWMSVVSKYGIINEDHMLAKMRKLKSIEARNYLKACDCGLKSVPSFISNNINHLNDMIAQLAGRQAIACRFSLFSPLSL